MINFENSIFSTEYSFASARNIIRDLSDAFSRVNCDTKGAPVYAAKMTKGRCLYCGEPLYSLHHANPEFTNLLHYDHIYPASKLNLFELGNVALACQTCNLAKSNRDPLEYYDIRTAEGGPLFIHNRDEFIKFLELMTKPYADKWPKHYEVNFLELNDQEFKEKLTELLYNHVDIAAAGNKYNHTHSLNWPIWERVINKANEIYTPSTAKDVEGRIGYANDIFEQEFGVTRLISDCSFSDLGKYSNKLLLSKYDSKNEIQKFRMLIKMLTLVLNEEVVGLDNFYETVPTYAQIKKEED